MKACFQAFTVKNILSPDTMSINLTQTRIGLIFKRNVFISPSKNKQQLFPK